MTASTPLVVFDYDVWTGAYPEFKGCSFPQGQNWFNQAGMLCSNNVLNIANRTEGAVSTLLYLLTSHIAWLNAPRDAAGNPASGGQPASPLVGVITDASEGSVSVSVQNDYPPGSAQWFQQTKYGAQYWALTAPYRTARYVPPAYQAGPLNPWPVGSPGWFRFRC